MLFSAAMRLANFLIFFSLKSEFIYNYIKLAATKEKKKVFKCFLLTRYNFMNVTIVFAVFLGLKKNTKKSVHSGSVVTWCTFIHGPSGC